MLCFFFLRLRLRPRSTRTDTPLPNTTLFLPDFLYRHGLAFDSRLARCVDDRALPGTGLDADRFWADFAALLARFAPENAALLARREALQAKIDAWHETRAGQPHDAAAYEAYLREIGYLVPEPAPFAVGTANVDRRAHV